MAILTMLTSSYVFSTPMGTPNLVLFSLLQRRQFDEFWAEVDAYLQRNQRSLSISASTKELLQRMLSIDPFERPLASEVALVLQDLPQPKDVEVFMQQRRLDL
jgi:serine/threonine protein kinase